MNTMISALILCGAITACAATNDPFRIPGDVRDLDPAMTAINTNWVGKVVHDVLLDKEIKEIVAVEHECSQAPLSHLVNSVRAVWKSQAKFETRPPADTLEGSALIFLVLAKDGSLLAIRFQGNYTAVTTVVGTAYFKD
jgi:hypothetical protein